MRVVIQRVSRASVQVEETVVGAINQGLCILVGVEDADTIDDADWLAAKVAKLRSFNDDEGKMNADLADVEGRLLVISQFTLHAKTKKGTRPSFIRAAHPEHAEKLYQHFVAACASADERRWWQLLSAQASSCRRVASTVGSSCESPPVAAASPSAAVARSPRAVCGTKSGGACGRGGRAAFSEASLSQSGSSSSVERTPNCPTCSRSVGSSCPTFTSAGFI